MQLLSFAHLLKVLSHNKCVEAECQLVRQLVLSNDRFLQHLEAIHTECLH